MLVAVAGMPASGKSSLLKEYEERGFQRIDDLNINWHGNIALAKSQLAIPGARIVVSDIEFCGREMRDRLEREVGSPVDWICFANDPHQCAKNVLHRYFVERKDRPWVEEIRKIATLSKLYEPPGETRPVVIAG